MCGYAWVDYRRPSRRATCRSWRADVAQLVAHHLAKVRVAGSNPVIRSKVQVASTPAVEWPSGEATACKAVHTGSIPVSTSKKDPARLAQRESASLTRKRSLVQIQYGPPVWRENSNASNKAWGPFRGPSGPSGASLSGPSGLSCLIACESGVVHLSH